MIQEFIQQIKEENAKEKYKVDYSAGFVYQNGEALIVTYATKGAEDTFSIGQPIYDSEHNLLGYLGIGLYDTLDYASDIRVPVSFWKICLPTEHCHHGVTVRTYWQNLED